MWALSFKHFFIEIQPNMSKQEKKLQRIYDLHHAEVKQKKKNSEIIGVSLCPQSRLNIKQDLWPDLKPLDYAIFGRFRKQKKIATSHRNIGLLKTTIEEEWNKMPEELILKVCKSFQRRVDTKIEKKGGYIG